MRTQIVLLVTASSRSGAATLMSFPRQTNVFPDQPSTQRTGRSASRNIQANGEYQRRCQPAMLASSVSAPNHTERYAKSAKSGLRSKPIAAKTAATAGNEQ